MEDKWDVFLLWFTIIIFVGSIVLGICGLIFGSHSLLTIFLSIILIILPTIYLTKMFTIAWIAYLNSNDDEDDEDNE